MDKLTAMQIIESVSSGEPSAEHVLEYTAASRFDKTPLRDMRAHLDHVAEGLSMVRFLNGGYGAGKSHTLAVLRKLALDRGFVVSQLALEARGVRFDMMERVFARMMETLSCADCTAAGKTVLEQMIDRWAQGRKDLEGDIDEIGLDPTLPDLRNALVCYAKLLRGEEPRNVSGRDRIEFLRRWFMPFGANLTGQERRLIGVFNNISAGNAGQVIEGLAVLFRGIGQEGWLVLIDEQEIVPTLLTERQRELCNQNLRVTIGAANQRKPPRAIYHVFASAPEFFTDAERGVNAYPALSDRIKANAVLELSEMDSDEMVEVGGRLVSIAQSAEPESKALSLVTRPVIRDLVATLQERFGPLRWKVRGFVQAIVALAAQAGPDRTMAHIRAQIEPILERTFQSIGEQIASAAKGRR